MSGSVLLLTTARAKRNALARRVVSDIKTLLEFPGESAAPGGESAQK